MQTANQLRYAKLVRLVIKEIRGKSTQKKMSEKLGYSFNQWHKWESGQKTLMLKDLKKIALELKINLNLPMQIIADVEDFTSKSSGYLVKKIIQKYGGFNSLQAQKRLSLSKATLHRIVTSRRDVEVAFIFECLGELSSTLPFFISFLAKNYKDSSLREVIYKMTRQVHLEGDFPWLSTIEACLETKQYKKLASHSDKFIANQLGLSTAAVKQGLNLLIENQAITKIADKYELNFKRVDMETSIVDSAKFANFWTRICTKRYNTIDGVPSTRKGWSSRVFPVSEEAHDEIVRLKDRFISDMTSVLQRDSERTKTKVQVFILHFFSNEEFKNLGLIDLNNQY